MVHHQIIVDHTEARGLIALSTKHREVEMREEGRKSGGRMDTEMERTFVKKKNKHELHQL